MENIALHSAITTVNIWSTFLHLTFHSFMVADMKYIMNVIQLVKISGNRTKIITETINI